MESDAALVMDDESSTANAVVTAAVNPYARCSSKPPLETPHQSDIPVSAAASAPPPRSHLHHEFAHTHYNDNNDDDMDEELFDNDEPPPDMEEFDEEAYNAQTSMVATERAAPDTASVAPTQTETLVLNHPEALFLGEEDDHEGVGMMDDPSVHASTSSVREAFSRGRKQEELYNFERYQENSSWRSKKTSSPMRAKEWKAAAKTKNEAFSLFDDDGNDNEAVSTTVIASIKPTAPDALLLSFLQRPLGVRKKCRMPRDPVPGRTCLPMTLGDGTRVHVPVLKETEPRTSRNSSSHHHDALGVSMDVLMKRVQTTRRKREYEKRAQQTSALNDIDRDVMMVNNSHDTMNLDDDVVVASNKKSTTAKSPTSVAAWNAEHSQLWVDKHAPSSFAHLLSDERCNREVVRALRAWDPYVFHREPPKRPDFQQKQHDAYTKNNNSEQHKKFSNEKDAQKSKDKRPEETSRVILLSGPPGVGKTTLAHIVARHAGYRPVEVNGSDERTETALTDRVVRAMESSTLDFGQDSNGNSKPNCLILDEIDGADAAKAIQALVDIIRAEIPSKGTKAKVPYLRRPIIFICNNKFAPALKPLLPYSRQFNVYPPSATRLVARLRSVLAAENMSLFGGSSLLNQLVTSTCGDIRSCLYTMQFASSRAKVLAASKTGEVHNGSNVDISKALQSALNGDGLKDERNDVVGTITTIFRKEKEDQFGAVAAGRGRKSMDKVLDAVSSFGDNSRILDCLFMNILRVSYIDPTFDRCAAAHEWMSSSDIYRSHKSDGLYGYAMEALHIPSATAAIHLLCRVEQRQDLTYSTRDLADSQYQMEANNALAQKFVEGLSLRARGTRNVNQLATDTVPYALWVLAAGEGSSALVRAATSVELLSNGERRAFEQHAASLRSLGLSYVVEQEDAVIGREHHRRSLKMRLEPPIEHLVQFVDLPNRRLDIPPALKQMLSRKAAHDRMLDHHNKESVSDPSKSNASAPFSETPTVVVAAAKATVIPVAKKAAPQKSEPIAKRKAQNNFLLMGAKNAKAARSARTAARVGCFEKSTKHSKLSNTGSGVPLSQVVRLKYVKGFTQAVSTPCRLEDLT